MSFVLGLKRYRDAADKQTLAIGLVWLFHLSAIIGVSIGFFDFFLPKTTINLSLSFLLLMWVFPFDSVKKCAVAFVCFLVGMIVEYLGVNYGYLFGTYSYGDNLGIKFGGVPWLIGVNWAMLVFITGVMANKLLRNKWLRIILGASLMIVLDLPMEGVAPIFDFWEFAGGVAPLSNYLAWFGIALCLHGVFQLSNINGANKYCFHLYICQFIFFTYFYGFYNL